MAADGDTPVAGIILAAGMSTRLGRPKQLLPLGGQTVLWWTARHALDSCLSSVLVVIGSEADRVRDALGSLPVRLVENPAYGTGQASSLRAGIAALPDEIGAAVMLLGDQPELDPAAIDAVIARWRETGAPVVMAAYRDRRAHPVLLARELFPELVKIGGDQGARAVIRRHQEHVATARIDGNAPADIDDEAAYRRLLARWR